MLPYGFVVIPAELRNAAVASATDAAFTVASVFVAMSTPLAQADAWMASRTLGAYMSRSFNSVHA